MLDIQANQEIESLQAELGKALHDKVYWQETARHYSEQRDAHYNELQYARREIERLRRSLEWFADSDNYVGDHDEDGYHSAPIVNGFKRASQALEGTSCK